LGEFSKPFSVNFPSTFPQYTTTVKIIEKTKNWQFLLFYHHSERLEWEYALKTKGELENKMTVTKVPVGHLWGMIGILCKI
jgi:hypothetical protein